jgi:flagellar basal-body rod protein FlgG
MYTSATGMAAMENNLDVISNNLANSETTGFKGSRVNFEDLMYRQEVLPGAQDANSHYTPTGIAYGMGVRVQSTQMNNSQGTIQQTGNQYDVAIQGNGYFRVTDPSTNQTLYTRAGNFGVNANGGLVIESATVGRLVDPQITIPQDATQVLIASDGTVSIQQPGNTNLQKVGQIEMAQFINPQGLLQLGQNLYQQTESSGTAQQANPGQQGMGTLLQGALESSNVEPVNELVNLIKTQRAFEFNSQVIQSANQLMQTVVQLQRY